MKSFHFQAFFTLYTAIHWMQIWWVILSKSSSPVILGRHLVEQHQQTIKEVNIAPSPRETTWLTQWIALAQPHARMRWVSNEVSKAFQMSFRVYIFTCKRFIIFRFFVSTYRQDKVILLIKYKFFSLLMRKLSMKFLTWLIHLMTKRDHRRV